MRIITISKIMEEKKTRNTQQKRVILQELQKVKSHPTAQEVFEMVRELIPDISLATVYRNLNCLVDSGQAVKLNSGDNEARFDGTIFKHYHARCLGCGKVEDVECSLLKAPECESSFKIKDHNLEFTGYCNKCQKQKSD